MKYFKYILFLLLFLLYFIGYRGFLSHVIFYHEQHHLFLFSSAYYHKTLLSEGLSGYVTNFVIQFFYYPALGSAILAFILASIYLLTASLIRLFIGRDEILYLSVIPSVLMFFHTMPVDNSLEWVIILFLSLLIVNLLVRLVQLFIKKKNNHVLPQPKNKYVKVTVTVAALILYTGLGYRYFMKSYNVSEHIMLQAEQYAKQKNWDKVYEYTENYLRRGRSNQLISYFHNLALYHKGKLPYQLFNYPQALGVRSIYFPWNSDSRESEYGYLLYEELGYINEAQRWEFEAMTVWGETAPHLINLARYNLANNRPLVAQRFINLLTQSLFYKGKSLEKHLNPLPMNSLDGVPQHPARFSNVINIGPELQYLLEHNPDNQMAFEYLMSQLLLSNHVERFAENLKYMDRFSYPQLPPVYEEALYIYQLGVSKEEFEKVGYTVSNETKQRFQHYYKLVQANQMEQLSAEFSKTYWFYLSYVSPYGNKVISN